MLQLNVIRYFAYLRLTLHVDASWKNWQVQYTTVNLWLLIKNVYTAIKWRVISGYNISLEIEGSADALF